MSSKGPRKEMERELLDLANLLALTKMPILTPFKHVNEGQEFISFPINPHLIQYDFM